MTKIKDKSLVEWKSWAKNEVDPPVVASDAVKYIIEAFLELIIAYEQLEARTKRVKERHDRLSRIVYPDRTGQ